MRVLRTFLLVAFAVHLAGCGGGGAAVRPGPAGADAAGLLGSPGADPAGRPGWRGADPAGLRGAGPLTHPVLYRAGTGRWYYLDQFNGSGPVADHQFPYGGDDSDLPVTGDFNGDGTRDVGVFRRSTGRWYLLTSRNESGPVDDIKLFYGGETTDVPMVGDWDGDGRDAFVKPLTVGNLGAGPGRSWVSGV